MWSRWSELQLLTAATCAAFLSTGQSCNGNKEQPQPKTTVPQLKTTVVTVATTSHHVTSDMGQIAQTEGAASGGYENAETETRTIVAIAVGVGSGLIVITMVTVVIVFCLRHFASKRRQQNLEADKSPSKGIELKPHPAEVSAGQLNHAKKEDRRCVNIEKQQQQQQQHGGGNKAPFASSEKDAATKLNDITLVDNDLYQG